MTPHLHTVKLEFTEVIINFLNFAIKVGTPRNIGTPCKLLITHKNRYKDMILMHTHNPQSIFISKNNKSNTAVKNHQDNKSV